MQASQAVTFDSTTGEVITTPAPLVTKPDPIELGQTGLVINGPLDYEDWHEFGRSLQQVEGAIQWWIGDWLNYGERQYGEMYAQAIEATEFAYSTLREYKWVASQVELSVRTNNLTWSHHRQVAGLEPDEQAYWLNRALKDGLSKDELRREIRATKALASVPEPNVDGNVSITVYDGDALQIMPTLPRQSFDLLLTDPPYNTQRMDWDTWSTPQDFIDWTRQWLEAALPLLKVEYNAFVFCSPHNAPDIEIEVLRPMELRVKSRIIWNHRNMSMGRDIADRFINTYDVILHFGTRALNWPVEWNDQRFDVQTYAAPQTNFSDTKLHQTQKPLELIKLLCSVGSSIGDNVFDPFAGAGTTGAACLELGRNCTMIDLGFADLAAKRVGVEVQRG